MKNAHKMLVENLKGVGKCLEGHRRRIRTDPK
jgi:hypothetical protein